MMVGNVENNGHRCMTCSALVPVGSLKPRWMHRAITSSAHKVAPTATQRGAQTLKQVCDAGAPYGTEKPTFTPPKRDAPEGAPFVGSGQGGAP